MKYKNEYGEWISGPKGDKGDPGPQGEPGNNSEVATDTVIAEVWGTEGSRTRQIFESIGESSIKVVPDRFPRIDNTGQSNASPELTRICENVPSGSRLQFEGTYLLESEWKIPAEKNLTLEMSGSEIKIGGRQYTSISCESTYQNSVEINQVFRAPRDLNGVTRETTVLSLAEDTGWVAGDIIKIYSQDVIPAAHITSTSSLPRVGEFAVVHETSGTEVVLTGNLVEKYTNSTRASKLNPGTVSILDLSVDTTDERLNSSPPGAVIALRNLTRPEIIRPRLKRLSSIGMQFNSCYGYIVDNPQSEYGINAVGELGTSISYLVHDSGSNYGYISGGLAVGGRHAFTDGASLVSSGDSNPQNYGGTIGTKWVGGTAKWMKAAGFDTHHMTYGVEFIGCTVYALSDIPCFTLRGRSCRIVSPITYGGSSLINIVSQVSTEGGKEWSRGDSYGHIVSNPVSTGTRQIISGQIRRSADHPQRNIRQDDPNIVVMGGVFNEIESIMETTNSTVSWTGTQLISLARNITFGGASINNTKITLDCWDIDASKVVGASGSVRVINAPDTLGGSVVDANIIKAKMTHAFASSAGSRFITVNSNIDSVKIRKFTIDSPSIPSIPKPVSAPGVLPGKVITQWEYVNGGTSASLELIDSAIETITSVDFGVYDPILFVMLFTTPGSEPRTLANLPPGVFTGQQIVLYSTIGTGPPVTIRNGLESNVAIGGSNKQFTSRDQAIRLIWTGKIWRQPTEI